VLTRGLLWVVSGLEPKAHAAAAAELEVGTAMAGGCVNNFGLDAVVPRKMRRSCTVATLALGARDNVNVTSVMALVGWTRQLPLGAAERS